MFDSIKAKVECVEIQRLTLIEKYVDEFLRNNKINIDEFKKYARKEVDVFTGDEKYFWKNILIIEIKLNKGEINE